MANIYKRGNKFYVVYHYKDDKGRRRQKWEGFSTKAEAAARLKQIEFEKEIGTFVVPKCNTLSELLDEYVSIYGKQKWAISTYESNLTIIEYYIKPVIGHMKLNEITPRLIERYYQQLLKMPAIRQKPNSKEVKLVTLSVIRDVNKLLRSCFNQARKWELVAKNPVELAMVPHAESAKREIWTAEELFHAIEVCTDDRLILALNLAFACSLRMGEMLGLTWDCVDLSQESLDNCSCSIQVNKELQRVSRKSMEALGEKDVVMKFPATSADGSTVLVLKTPKTVSSIRKVFLPNTVAEMLIAWKKTQDNAIKLLGEEYRDYNLVFAGDLGRPTEASTINKALQKLIRDNNLPPVVFHSLRHSSITYKLKLNGGDIKAVQGDSGHSQVKMVADVYSHILDDSRVNNARLFEEAFYSGQGRADEEKPAEPETVAIPEGIEAETLTKLLQNPEMVALIKTLAKSL